ncbi:J domain-containing protein spf31-like [Phoenix dactylifera]|uniref:J domain-containing protein spf31-like n=1 Tax=Phoenix dactylifera TaxID=42345 RepID=A0A8B7BNZ2_PHODC|nr:J domain-containing protein spf31-like [Phoenix dactylifera]
MGDGSHGIGRLRTESNGDRNKSPLRPFRSPIPCVRSIGSFPRKKRGAPGPLVPIRAHGEKAKKPELAIPMAAETEEDLLLKSFLAEVSEVERDNEVVRILSCFKLNPFEHLNLPFDSSTNDVKKRYRKLSLLVHPDKCKHPQAKEAFSALAKAQQLLLDPQEREYLLTQINAAKEELRMRRKKQLKKDSASKIKALVDEGKCEQQFEQSEEFQQQLKMKVREILTQQEWRRRKMQMRISEEEGRLKKDEEETKEMWKRKREHEEQWEETRDQRVSSWRDFMKTGKKGKKGETRPPKLKTEDPNRSYVQRPVKRV